MLQMCTRQSSKVVGIVIAIIVVSGGVFVSWHISQTFATDTLMEKSEALRHELECAQCNQPKERNCRRCGAWQWRSERISAGCLQESLFRSKVDQIIENQMEEENRELNREMTKSQFLFRTLEQVSGAQYQSPRVIMHWFPLGLQTKANSTWTEITAYERHRSTYTVSEGPNGSCDEHGHMVATEMGLHLVYAKLTFSCRRADMKIKHVAMEVSLIESSDYDPFIILKERQLARCSLAGDLVTLYQSGLIRMGKGNKLKLRYHVSDSEIVQLSTGRGEAFKSCLGMYRIGLA